MSELEQIIKKMKYVFVVFGIVALYGFILTLDTTLEGFVVFTLAVVSPFLAYKVFSIPKLRTLIENRVVKTVAYVAILLPSCVLIGITILDSTHGTFSFFTEYVTLPFISRVEVRTVIPIVIMLLLYLRKYNPISVILLIPVYYALHEFIFNFVLFVIKHHEVPFTFALPATNWNLAPLYYANFLQPAMVVFLFTKGRNMLLFSRRTLISFATLVAFFVAWFAIGFPLSIDVLNTPMIDPSTVLSGSIMEFFWSCAFIFFFYNLVKPIMSKLEVEKIAVV